MRIRDLAHKDGVAGAWRATSRRIDLDDANTAHIREIWHYSTLMLKFNTVVHDDEAVLDYSVGWGSVSDQGGMNQLFRELNLPLYYVRQGGARIVELVKNEDEYWTHPETERIKASA